MKAIPALLLLCVLALTVRAQQAAADARINELERKLEQATLQIGQLGELIKALRAELSRLKEDAPQPRANSRVEGTEAAAPSPSTETPSDRFVERIVDPSLGQSDRY